MLHKIGLWAFDPFPFILLNLVFSIQSAYAAPLILLGQIRQADRDNAHAEAQHKEALALNTQQQQLQANQLSAQLIAMMEQNTKLTELTKELTERIELLTKDLHAQLITRGG